MRVQTKLFCSLLLLTLTPLGAAAQTPVLPPNGANPDAAAAAGPDSDAPANVSWWGFDAADSTAFVQAAVDSGAKTVVIPYVGAPWVITPVTLRGNLTLLFEPGVVVLAKRGQFQGTGDSLFTARDCENVTLRGYGATLRMWKQDYQKAPYKKGEWRMCLDFSGCTNLRVEGLRLEYSGGDGIYIGCTDKQPYCKDVVIRDVVCHEHHRQGISVIGAENLLIENCVFSNTGGTPPAAGIDFEPNQPKERLTNCVLRNCTTIDNDGAGILIYLKPLSSETAPISILVENCFVRGGRDTGLGVGALGDNGPKGSIEFRNCTVEGTDGGLYLYDKSPDAAQVRFVNCNWKDVGKGSKLAPLLLHLRRPEIATRLGGVEFSHCTLFDTADRPAVAIDGKDKDREASGITGDITVRSAHTPRTDFVLQTKDVSLQLLQGVPVAPQQDAQEDKPKKAKKAKKK